MDHLFAGVKWKCTSCGADAGTCSCWIRQTHPILIETFEGVEAAKRDQQTPGT